MFFGLLSTGIVAYYTAHSPALLNLIFGSQITFYAFLFAPIVLVMIISSKINSLSASMASFLFFVYSAVTGVTLSAIFLMYTQESIATTFGITAGTFGKYEGVYLRYHEVIQDGFFNQRIYLFCPEEYRVITIYVGDDVSKEDALKVADNLQITEKDTMIETAGMYTWSDIVSPEEVQGDEAVTSISADRLPVAKVGEKVDLTASGEDKDGNYADNIPIQATVDSVQITDDLQLLNGQIPEEWKDAVGEDGKLKENTISYIREGDGVNTLDEVVKTKTEQQKLVYTTVTYTNTSDQEADHILYLGSLMMCHNDGSTYKVYTPGEEAGDGYDRCTWDGAARTGEMKYCSVTENYGNGGNYIPSLKPGESIQISMAWIVNESDLKEMYLNLNGTGAAYQFDDEILANGIIDIRQN